jgi:hypothetical protein
VGGRALTLENVLSLIPQEEVMEKYLGFRIYPMLSHRVYLNPFRNDTNPNCRLSYKNGVLLFTDYASQYFGDAVAICSYRLNTDLYGALIHLNNEYKLGLGYDDKGLDINVRPMPVNQIIHTPKTYSEIKYAKYEDFADNDYFFSYHISKSTLEKYRVYSCQTVWVDNEIFRDAPNAPLYIYDFKDNGCKMYRPLSKKEKKWRSNVSRNYIQGGEFVGDGLVIRTSSLKDVMVLHEIGLQADAPNCENILVTPREHMLLLYDNDKAGVTNMIKHSKTYNCEYFTLPLLYHNDIQLKDPSDIAKTFGLDYLKELLYTKYNGRYSEQIRATIRT